MGTGEAERPAFQSLITCIGEGQLGSEAAPPDVPTD